MILAAMIAKSEEDLICDFAETYHIYDWRSLPVGTAAILAIGLRDDSRIKRRLSGARYDKNTLLLAAIADRLSILVWHGTKDGQKGKNKPKMIMDTLLSGPKKSQQTESYATPEEYLAAREKIVEEINHGGD